MTTQRQKAKFEQKLAQQAKETAKPLQYDENTDLNALLQNLLDHPAQVYLGPQPGPGSRGWGGAATGAMTGAALGTALWPGVGTVAGGVIGGLAGRGGANTAAKDAYNAAREQAINRAEQIHAAQIEQVKREILRRQLTAKVNAAFHSDQLGGLYDNLKNVVLQNALGDVMQQYQSNVRGQGFQTARQGLQGSTVDAERRGQAANELNQGAVSAAGQADQFVSGLRNQNESTRQHLVQTMTSDNPGDAGVINSSIQNVMNQTQALTQNYAQQAAQRQLSQYGLNLNSQALGNLLTTYGKLYQTNQLGQAYQGGV